MASRCFNKAIIAGFVRTEPTLSKGKELRYLETSSHPPTHPPAALSAATADPVGLKKLTNLSTSSVALLTATLRSGRRRWTCFVSVEVGWDSVGWNWCDVT
jgi:hypothetical protein